MVHHLIHEITVVAHHNHAPGEVLQIFLQYLERHDVQVVRRLVEHQEVGVLHQHRTQIELPALTTTQLIHIVMLLFGREEEILQKLRGREVLATAHVDILRDILHHVDHLLLLVKLQALLREVAKPHRVANVEATTVRWHHTQQHLDKRRLTRTVVAHDTHLLKSREVIVKILQDNSVFKSF